MQVRTHIAFLPQKRINIRPSRPLLSQPPVRFGNEYNFEATTALNQAIVQYAETPDLRAIAAAIRPIQGQSVEMNIQDTDGNSPIHYVIRHGDDQVLKLVLRNGAMPITQTNDGIFPIHLAVRLGRLDMVKTLDKAGASLEEPVKQGLHEGDTPLMEAVDTGDFGMIQYLASRRVNLNARNARGETALYRAANRGDSEMVVTLLDLGADGEIANKWGWTPLMVLAQNEPDTYAFEALLHSGVDVHAKNSDNETVWRFVMYSLPDLLEQKVQLLLDYGLNKDSHTQGQSLLQYAAFCGDKAIYEKLEKLGANIRGRDSLGRDTFALAARSGNAELAEHVYKQGGFDINTRDHAGETPLIEVVSSMVHDQYAHQKMSILDFLIRNGADLNARDNLGQTALMKAAEYARCDMIPKLIDHGADINAQDNAGRTALMLAVHSGCREAYSHLMDRGADTRLRDKQGKSLNDYKTASPFWYEDN